MANQHIVYRGHNEWAIRKENASRDTLKFHSQSDAYKAAKDIVVNQGGGEVFIHARNGKIRERNTFGHDPRDIEG